LESLRQLRGKTTRAPLPTLSPPASSPSLPTKADFLFSVQWATGYSSHFGLQYVNMSDPALPRYYKASFFEYKNTFDIYQEK